MLSEPQPIETASRFPPLLDRLLSLLESLSAEEWAAPTAALPWTVKDVALHLLGDEIGILSWRRDHFSDAPPSISTWEGLVAWINRRNAQWVEGTSRISPRVLCDLLRHTGQQANELFASLDPYVPGGEVSWAASGPAPAWLEIAREFTERWHHQQHIRDAVGQPGCTEPVFLTPVLDAFVRALPRTYRDVDAPPNSKVVLEISGPSGGAWTVVRESGGWKLYLGRPDKSDAEVRLPEDTAWRLFTRGVTREQAREKSRTSGDHMLAEKLLETISIIA